MRILEWISVEDKLPKAGRYLCAHSDKCVFVGKYEFGKWSICSNEIGSGLWQVTHWMPLPDYPVTIYKINEEIACPWCGIVESYSLKKHLEENNNWDVVSCSECKNYYKAERHIKVTYSTEKIE